MQNSPQTSESSSGLDELMEKRIRGLAEILSRPYNLEEIEGELAALNDLVYPFKRRDELLAKLVDSSTAEEKRRQIREMLNARHIKVAEDQAEAERIHARSHELLQKSTQLIIKAQHEINSRAHKFTGYGLEVCGLCNGIGGTSEEPCPPCKGEGSVLVHQPALKCPRCKGDGRPSHSDQFNYLGVCIVCRGSGWAMTDN